jgi:hypothetical protein
MGTKRTEKPQRQGETMKYHCQQENPIISIMASHNLTRQDLAIICDVDYIIVCQTLHASSPHPPRKMLSGLESLGYDPRSVDAQYVEFRTEVREGLLASRSEANGAA